ncbi:MAG: hypothetical protein ABID38_03260 [Candidatus Diapherotrites archaeon]
MPHKATEPGRGRPGKVTVEMLESHKKRHAEMVVKKNTIDDCLDRAKKELEAGNLGASITDIKLAKAGLVELKNNLYMHGLTEHHGKLIDSILTLLEEPDTEKVVNALALTCGLTDPNLNLQKP